MTLYHPKKRPIIFTEFFDLGLPEEESPFLTPTSKSWGKNLYLRGSVLSALLLTLAFLFHFFEPVAPLSPFLLGIVFFVVGIPALIDTIEDAGKLIINIDMLMTLAAFLSILIGSPMEGALLLVLFALSEAMGDAVSQRAKGAINTLYQLSPPSALALAEDGEYRIRSVKDLIVGSIILVRAGEIIPLDGDVIEGSSSVNLVHLTGENLPVLKTVGDEVPGGGKNMDGALILRVKRTAADSTIAKIIDLVTEAQAARPQLQRWFDRVSQTYATTVIGLTAFFSVALTWFQGIPYIGIEGSFYRSIAFLIAASPCALIIAIPIAYLSAISACAGRGILLKGGAVLDALDHCEAIALDKTGTLTTGQLRCVSIIPLSDSTIPEETALAIALAMEERAVHPIGRAISAHAQQRNVKPHPLKDFKSIPGYGLQGIVEFQEKEWMIFIGNQEFIRPKVTIELQEQIYKMITAAQERGELVALLLVGQHLFLFTFEDTLRPGIQKTLIELKKRGLEPIMLTGDHAPNAKKIADQLSIETYYADLTPEEKLRHITALSEKKGLAMVGDGVNDAPALARASVGIGMGRMGSATALEASDIILLNDNIEALGWLFKKAHQTQNIVKQNLFIASAVILLATTPALLGWVPLWVAVLLHEGGTVMVGLNALRLLERKNKSTG